MRFMVNRLSCIARVYIIHVWIIFAYVFFADILLCVKTDGRKGGVRMKWLSIDPANHTGLAYWDGNKLIATFTARAMGSKGKWIVEGGDNIKKVYDGKWELFVKAFEQQDALFIEEGFGTFSTAVKSQGHFRGYFQAVNDYLVSIGHKITTTVLSVNEWRRVIKEETGISWPATTERKKELAIKHVQTLYGIRVNNDEADAVLLGRAVIKMGVITMEVTK